MLWWDKLAEERIRAAELEGAFDNLEGEGKPLPPDPFFRLPEDTRLAARVLTICGCAPQEVGLLREMHEARHRLRGAATAEERAERMREYSEAEFNFNIAMERHREMFSDTPPRRTSSGRGQGSGMRFGR